MREGKREREMGKGGESGGNPKKKFNLKKV